MSPTDPYAPPSARALLPDDGDLEALWEAHLDALATPMSRAGWGLLLLGLWVAADGVHAALKYDAYLWCCSELALALPALLLGRHLRRGGAALTPVGGPRDAAQRGAAQGALGRAWSGAAVALATPAALAASLLLLVVSLGLIASLIFSP